MDSRVTHTNESFIAIFENLLLAVECLERPNEILADMTHRIRTELLLTVFESNILANFLQR